MPVRFAGRIALVGLILAAAPGVAAPPVSADPPGFAAAAAAAEAAGEWEKAAELYLRSMSAGGVSADVRAKAQHCLRRAAQTRRHRDPGFRQFVTTLEPADALGLYAEVIGTLSTTYADRDRCSPARLFALGLDEVERAVADPAFRKANLAEPPDPSAFRQAMAAARGKSPGTARECRQAVLDLIPAAKQGLGLGNGSVLVFECLCGACTGLDEYTVYVAPTDRGRAGVAQAVTELAAYGILVAFRADGVHVEAVLPDSYAALNLPHLRPGDRLLRLNGRTLGPPASLADALRNPSDGRHEFEAAAGDGSPLPVTLPTPVPTVLGADVLRDGVGYLRVTAFRETTPGEVETALLRLRDRGMPLRSLVLDLRGNAGGSFTAGVRTAERFVPSGILVTTRGQAPEVADRVFSSAAGMTAFDLPLVVLVDTRTMSSAEIVAAALKGQSRAELVGLPTFGKGVVQCPFRLTAADLPAARPPRGSGVLIVTIAKAFAPTGEPIHGVGVVPHVIEADPDRQLAVAVERAAMLAGMR